MKVSQKQYERDQAYIKANISFVSVPFNGKNPEEMKLYNWLNDIPEKKSTYIKRLIQEDMNKAGK